MLKFKKMKLLYKTLICLAIIFTSCSKDDDTVTPPATKTDPTTGITKFKELTNDTHVVEIYSHHGEFNLGYNEVFFRIKNKSNNTYITDATVNWMPVMHMTMMNHSCPKSTPVKSVDREGMYQGYIVFQMPPNETEYWELKIDYTTGGKSYSVSDKIDVENSDHKVVSSFTGTDGVKYIAAYIEPHHPKVATQEVIMGLFKMQDMMNFPVVDNYTIKIDPRMPSMGNHGSPNNVDLTQKSSNGFYYGKLSLTMTGYWKLNLQVAKPDTSIIKGEAVTETTESSSLFFELEF
jgi:hypothetical protein